MLDKMPAPTFSSDSAPAKDGLPVAVVDERFIARKSGKAIIDFSLYYFGDYADGGGGNKYDFLIDGARFADSAGLEAVWLPERHFHSFGGFSPNPSVVAAALARETTSVALRASVLLPLHHPVRVAEEWAVVDNLSGGRIGLAFASGWHANDFVFNPEAWGRNRDAMVNRIGAVQRLWMGQSVTFPGPEGRPVEVSTFPPPSRGELPLWLTTLGSKETYELAGRMGLGVLTNLLGQTIEELAGNIALYRRARQQAGLDPASGHVTVLVHTLIGRDLGEVREQARAPFCRYLLSSIGLFQKMVRQEGLAADFDALTDDDRKFLLNTAYERYVGGNSLIGTVESCSKVVDALASAGVDEVACFVDFGVDHDVARRAFMHIAHLRERYVQVIRSAPPLSNPAATMTFADEVAASVEHGWAARSQGEGKPAQRRGCRLPLSDDQRMILLLAQMGESQMMAYSWTLALRLSGPLDVEGFRRAYRALVDRHEALRITIDTQGGDQLIGTEQQALPVVDFSALPADQADERLAGYLRAECTTPYQLDCSTHRAALIVLNPDQHLFVFSAHQVAIDGWSIGILMAELASLYSAETGANDADCALDPAPQFSDYLAWRERNAGSAEYQRQEAFWLSKVSNGLAGLDLPTDRPRPPVRSFNGDRLVFRLSPDLCMRLRNFVRREGCTNFMAVFGAFALLMHRLARQDEVVIGVPFSGRRLPEGERIVGYLSNMYPMVSRVDAAGTVRDYLGSLRDALLDAYDNQDYPFSDLIIKGLKTRDPSRPPFFSVAFNWDRVSLPELPGLTVTQELFGRRYVTYDLMPNLMEVDDTIEISLNYNTDLFDRATIERITIQFETLLEAIVDHPQQPVAALPLHSEADRWRLLVEWNDTARPLPDASLLTRFESRAARTPERLAVVCGEVRLTYAELNRRANQLARVLRKQGVGPEVLVGVCLERSVDMVTAMLAVWKAGAAFLVLDPDYPAARTGLILVDARTPLLLTRRALADGFGAAGFAGKLICLEEVHDCVGAEDGSNLEQLATPENLAYVLYTSGSTGRPKGVAVEHRHLQNYVAAICDRLDFKEGMSFALVSTPSADLGNTAIYPALCGGGTLHVISRDLSMDAVGLARCMQEERIDCLKITPSHLAGLMAENRLDDLVPQQRLVFGGELLNADFVRQLRRSRPGTRIFNHFGPTEATVGCCTFEVVADAARTASIPIGRPIANTQIYVLDERLEVVPIGSTGELYIAGAGLARGYLHRADLTAERFVANPFGSPGERMYRTGDLARWRADGELEFLGRVDHQVKVRGFRIELGEIEAALLSCRGVSQAVALARADGGGELRLVIYVTASPERAPEVAELRLHLKQALPDYMLPSAYVILDEFPLTLNGKIDRKALPAPEGRASAVEYVAARNPTEEMLAAIWAEVLSLGRIGIHDNFFEMGGHSLLAMRIVSLVRNRMGLEMPLRLLFEAPTICELSEHLEGTMLLGTLAQALPRNAAREVETGVI
jgi:natural product biosynthesis luciferase-like monooxygenase protein/amino acid adenylation domain-containing protein